MKDQLLLLCRRSLQICNVNLLIFEKNRLGEKSVNDHLEEYYAMDFDDVIGDMPCRFRYRNVAASNFGLSTEDVSFGLFYYYLFNHGFSSFLRNVLNSFA